LSTARTAPIYLDATSVLRWGPNAPTGIPRIEASLIEAALVAEPDRAGLFGYDPTLNHCRVLDEEEKVFVRRAFAEQDSFSVDAARALGWWRRLRRVVALYRLNPFCIARESHRSIAQYLVASSGRSGPLYLIAKLAVRGAFAVVRGWRQLRRRHGVEDPLADPGATCLLSINTAASLAKYAETRAVRCRMVLLVYDTTPLDFPELAAEGHGERFGQYFRYGVAHAAAIICISEATRGSVLAWMDRLRIARGSRSVHVVPLASSLSAERTPLVPVSELAGGPFVLYCATIEPRKNHALLLSVWSNLVRRHGRENLPTLVLVGRWGWRTEATARLLAQDRNLAGTVRIFSYLPDGQLAWLYRNALFTVFPSIAEGWGLGATESLDAGTPVVVSDIPPLIEASQGLMPRVAPADAARWESTIEGLIFHPEERAALKTAIEQRFRRRLPADVFAEIWQHLTVSEP